MSIRIVTHCYAKTLPQYAVFLRAQLSSLAIYDQPDSDRPATVTVCCTPDDKNTQQVLDDFKHLLGNRLTVVNMTKSLLFRRSIGRNKAALDSTEDLVWFTDVDHIFHKNCLNELDKIWSVQSHSNPYVVMLWPKMLQIHKTHEIGHKFWRSHTNETGPIVINPDDFYDKHYTKAIGGVQIVNGRFARQYGYLNDFHKWRQPVVNLDKPFPSFSDDCKFRRFCASKGVLQPIDLPGLYRLRHLETTYKS